MAGRSIFPLQMCVSRAQVYYSTTLGAPVLSTALSVAAASLNTSHVQLLTGLSSGAPYSYT